MLRDQERLDQDWNNMASPSSRYFNSPLARRMPISLVYKCTRSILVHVLVWMSRAALSPLPYQLVRIKDWSRLNRYVAALETSLNWNNAEQ